jgi:uncharacterized membrane protein
MSDESAKGSGEEKGLDRIISLSDGVFAFALTLLVLGLAVPALKTGETRTSLNLLGALAGDATAFYSYAISFFVIGIWWLAHHRLFRYVERYDAGLMWRNLFFLLFVTIIPFLTQLLDTYGDVLVAVIIYDLVQVFGGIALNFIWRYVAEKHFITKSLSQNQIESIRNRGVAPALVFLLAIGVAFFLSAVGIAPAYAQYSLVSMAPVSRLLSKRATTAE